MKIGYFASAREFFTALRKTEKFIEGTPPTLL